MASCRLPARFLVRATAGDLSQSPATAARPAPGSVLGVRVLVIDNYDSFVYNLVQYLGELGAEPVVHRHDAVALDALRRARARRGAGLARPGQPGRPEDAGVSNDAIRAFGEAGVPVLGVCLGHQCIGQIFGGEVVRAPHVMHGKTSQITHDGAGRVRRAPDPVHRHPLPLAGRRARVRARRARGQAESEDGLVMGLRHRDLPIEGVQFHPESILTEAGHSLLGNFLAPTVTRLTASGQAGATRRSTTARPSATSDASASASSSRGGARPVAQLAPSPRRAAGGSCPRTAPAVAASRRASGPRVRAAPRSGHSAHDGSRGRHSTAPTSMSASRRSRPRSGRPTAHHRRPRRRGR